MSNAARELCKSFFDSYAVGCRIVALTTLFTHRVVRREKGVLLIAPSVGEHRTMKRNVRLLRVQTMERSAKSKIRHMKADVDTP